MTHTGTQTIETDRLILRQFTGEDVGPSFRNWAGDPKVTRYLTWPTHSDESVTRRVVTSWIGNYRDKTFYQWAIVLKESKESVGTISYVEIDEKTESVSIGYCLGSTYWHQGFMSEALKAIIAFSFQKVGVNRVMATHDVENPNSGKVMAKCGMRYEGTLRQAHRNNRGLVDICVYGILKEDFTG